MPHKRNTRGIQAHARAKHEACVARVEKAIRRFIRERKAINFGTVSKAASVSLAFLYKHPELKERITHLRQKSTGAGAVIPQKERPSGESKDAIITALRARVKKLTEEVQELRQQNEAAYASVF
jgi:hypothetical protein